MGLNLCKSFVNGSIKGYIENMFKSVISTAGVLLALIVISVIQYNWLIQSTERDMAELYKNINFNIYRTISWEIESELFGFREVFGTSFRSEDELKEFVETLESKYLYSIGYNIDGKSSTYRDGLWSQSEEKSTGLGKLHGYLVPQNNGLVKFNFPLRFGDKGLDGFIKFDFKSFYYEQITSSLNNTMGEYEFIWHYSFPENAALITEEDYKYSPYKVIYNRLFQQGTKKVFGITLFIDGIRNRGGISPKILMKEKISDGMHKNQIFVEIYSGGKPLIPQKENYITLQWLATLLLLIGIGVTYIFILNQVKNLKRLRQKEKMFVATITHELRTPLTVINTAADNIQSGTVQPERLKTYGDLIKDQSKRLTNMVEGILLFSRFEGKKERPPKLAPVNLQNLQIDLERLNEDLDINIPIQDPILSDRESIYQILSNLINNATKHAYKLGESGPIRLRTHIKMPNRVIFSVEDDGLGLERGDKRYIFKPFYRAKRSYEEQRKGSGLGLYISWNRAKLLGGELRVESPYERPDGTKRPGCRFILELPYNTVDEDIDE